MPACLSAVDISVVTQGMACVAWCSHGRTTAPESLQPRAVWFHCARIAAVAASWSAEDWHFMARPFEQLCADRDTTGACFGAESIQIGSFRFDLAVADNG